jgi:hypothetical protein
MSQPQWSHEQEKLSSETFDIRIYPSPDIAALPIIHYIGGGLQRTQWAYKSHTHDLPHDPKQLEASVDVQSI